MHQRQRLGQRGEALAATFLEAAGYVILARNWRVSRDGVRGEIDLIAQRRDLLAFVEVKTRTGATFGTAVEAVGFDKRRRLRRLVGAYLATHPHAGPVRGDVVTVRTHPGEPSTVVHLRGVW